MGRIIVLTDNSAQFPTASFPGHELVDVIPLHIQIKGQLFQYGKGIKANNLPVTAMEDLDPIVLPPTVEEFQETFKRLGERCDEIVVLLISSHLNPAITNANNAAESFLGRVKIHIVDSQTTSVGLGLLTQVAAKAASEGLSGVEIIRTVRGVMPHIYALFCIPGLTYLHYAGFLGIAQALVGEKLAVITLFVMENGQLIPVQKARSSRHLVDCLHEFVCEFGNIQHIAVMQGVPPFEQEVRSLRERFSVDFDSGLISEHKISPALGSLIGPRSLGIFVMDR